MQDASRALRGDLPRALCVQSKVMPTADALREYDARVDAKKRVTIRGAKFRIFRVLPQADGSIILKPREAVSAPVSKETVSCIEKSVASMKAGKRSKPEDLKKLAAMKI
jgi:hypothetical protein